MLLEVKGGRKKTKMKEEANLTLHHWWWGTDSSVKLHHGTVPSVFGPSSCLTQLSVETGKHQLQLWEAARLPLWAVATCSAVHLDTRDEGAGQAKENWLSTNSKLTLGPQLRYPC